MVLKYFMTYRLLLSFSQQKDNVFIPHSYGFLVCVLSRLLYSKTGATVLGIFVLYQNSCLSLDNPLMYFELKDWNQYLLPAVFHKNAIVLLFKIPLCTMFFPIGFVQYSIINCVDFGILFLGYGL